jgi:hypothetical protein
MPSSPPACAGATASHAPANTLESAFNFIFDPFDRRRRAAKVDASQRFCTLYAIQGPMRE